jgi:hypothetical protein
MSKHATLSGRPNFDTHVVPVVCGGGTFHHKAKNKVHENSA